MQSGLIASQQQLLRKQASLSGSPPDLKSPSSPVHKNPDQSPVELSPNNNDYIVVDSDTTSPSVNTRAKKTRRSAPSSSWLSVLNPSYKTRAEEFRKLFSDTIPSNERLVVDYSCALQKEILVHGRVYVTLNYICFYANIFKWETRVVIKCRDITSLSKAHTAKVIPNAIRITTSQDEKYVLTSFAARDKTYVMMFRVWQNALLDHSMSSSELWSWVHYSYGNDLGFSSDEEEEIKGEDISNLQSHRTDGLSDSMSSDESKSSGLSDRLRRSTNLVGPKTESIQELTACDADDDQEESLPFLEPITCPCSEHRGKLLADQVFPISVDTIFTLIFSESKFYKKVMNDRKAIDLAFTPWSQVKDTDTDGTNEYIKSRVVNYTVVLNHTMVKAAPTTETQYVMDAHPGEYYRARTDAVNTEIPYCDTFYVRTQFCLTRGRHENESRILVYSEVIFTSTSWSFKLMKPIIEKNAVQGITDFIRDLVSALDKYCNEGPSLSSEIVEVVELESELRRPSKKSDSLKSGASLRRRLDEANNSMCWSAADIVHVAPCSLSSTLKSLRTNSLRENSIQDIIPATSHIKIVIWIIVALALFNIFLFYHLRKLETAVDDYEVVMKSFALRSTGNSPVPDAQAISSLRKILSKAVEMARTIERNLEELNQDLSTL